jgi:hypothetical protein
MMAIGCESGVDEASQAGDDATYDPEGPCEACGGTGRLDDGTLCDDGCFGWGPRLREQRRWLDVSSRSERGLTMSSATIELSICGSPLADAVEAETAARDRLSAAMGSAGSRELAGRMGTDEWCAMAMRLAPREFRDAAIASHRVMQLKFGLRRWQ